MPDPGRVLPAIVWKLVGIVVLCAVSAEPQVKGKGARGGRVEYIGGTVDAIGQGSAGLLQTTDADYLVLVTRNSTLRVVYDRVNLLEYGQRVSRRYALAILVSPIFILSKKRVHYLTVGFTGDDGKQQALVFTVAKDDIRTLLASLEARTGQRVEFQDEEARRAGRG
jgi:hypothetical protein